MVNLCYIICLNVWLKDIAYTYVLLKQPAKQVPSTLTSVESTLFLWWSFGIYILVFFNMVNSVFKMLLFFNMVNSDFLRRSYLSTWIIVLRRYFYFSPCPSSFLKYAYFFTKAKSILLYYYFHHNQKHSKVFLFFTMTKCIFHHGQSIFRYFYFTP